MKKSIVKRVIPLIAAMLCILTACGPRNTRSESSAAPSESYNSAQSGKTEESSESSAIPLNFDSLDAKNRQALDGYVSDFVLSFHNLSGDAVGWDKEQVGLFALEQLLVNGGREIYQSDNGMYSIPRENVTRYVSRHFGVEGFNTASDNLFYDMESDTYHIYDGWDKPMADPQNIQINGHGDEVLVTVDYYEAITDGADVTKPVKQKQFAFVLRQDADGPWFQIVQALDYTSESD